MTAVLDASAILALLQAEPGADAVEATIAEVGAMTSAVNMAEVEAKLHDVGFTQGQIDALTDALPIFVAPFNREMAKRSGTMRPTTRAGGLSLGDRACLATALELDLPALTMDRAWHDVDLGVEVRVLR